MAELVTKKYTEEHPHGNPGANYAQTVGLHKCPMVRVAAVGLVNSYGQILICLNKKLQVWDITQGGVEEGETAGEAAIRELKEELGLDITIKDLEIVSTFRHRTSSFVYPFETTLFTVKEDMLIDKVTNCEPDRIEQVKWVSPIQMPYPRGLSLRILMTLMGHA